MTDKRVEKNKENIVNLKAYLMDICQQPGCYLDIDGLRKSLKSQGGISKIESEDFSIVKSSLNTLKRTAPMVLEGGFDELDKLRVMAINKLDAELSKGDKSNKRTRDGLSKRVKELEEQLNETRKVQLMLINELMNHKQTFQSIENTESIELHQDLANEAISRINSFALLEPSLMPIAEQEESNVIKFKKGEK